MGTGLLMSIAPGSNLADSLHTAPTALRYCLLVHPIHRLRDLPRLLVHGRRTFLNPIDPFSPHPFIVSSQSLTPASFLQLASTPSTFPKPAQISLIQPRINHNHNGRQSLYHLREDCNHRFFPQVLR
ncbi:hypothetical protein BDW69DRAFT_111002 [Aspergillus filifer]